MPNIFKHFMRAAAEPYQFPDAEELIQAEELPPEEVLLPEEGLEDLDPQGERTAEPLEEPPEENPISFAQIQADSILEDARRQAEQLLEDSRQSARQEAEQVFAAAREDGRREGYGQGLAQARQEAAKEREEQAKRLEEQVERFLTQAGSALDRQMDQNIDELRDLALAIAEKVVCVSLKSSADVISRMIQTAVDKRKRREWVHIYIAECDAKRLSQLPASLSATLSGLSDRVRIIPMGDDESGTCIIETPDEIIDASAATQLNNIRSILMDTAGGGGGSLF
ncbi:MAG: F0F1 ATP synthase subunit delta [Flavonifractor sp.]|nr:F0F1 ATP synthase subunit delta [Flavonifractor sp.]MCI9424023.1 F0F1 ATP synthase subunit delta [Flavonifractor sp.]MCI9472505.1 F0F1 ATP synthase subunit delta [Flavonifractor sp.]